MQVNVQSSDSQVRHVAMRPLRLAGQNYKPGDEMPPGLAARKLEQLCRHRMIRAELAPIKAASKVVDLDELTHRELVELCRSQGASPYGNGATLRKRLRALVV